MSLQISITAGLIAAFKPLQSVLSFICAYKVYKELETQLKIKKAGMSPEKAINIAKTIYRITIQTKLSKTLHSRLFIDKKEQQNLLELFNL